MTDVVAPDPLAAALPQLLAVLGDLQHETGRQSGMMEALSDKIDAANELADRRDKEAGEYRHRSANAIQQLVTRVALVERQLEPILPLKKAKSSEPLRLGGADPMKKWSAIGWGVVTFFGAIGYFVSPFIPLALNRMMHSLNLR